MPAAHSRLKCEKKTINSIWSWKLHLSNDSIFAIFAHSPICLVALAARITCLSSIIPFCEHMNRREKSIDFQRMCVVKLDLFSWKPTSLVLAGYREEESLNTIYFLTFTKLHFQFQLISLQSRYSIGQAAREESFPIHTQQLTTVHNPIQHNITSHHIDAAVCHDEEK